MSSRETGGFRPKPADALTTQTGQVSEHIGAPVVPPSVQHSFLNKPLDELKKRFPNYYDVYLQSLRSLRQKEEDRSSPADKNHEQETKDMTRQWENNRPIRDNLQKYLSEHHLGLNGKTLREKQVTVFEDMRDFVEDGGVEGHIKLPTGTGKTVLFTEFIEATGLKTLIVAPTNIIVDQTGQKIERFAPDVDFGKINAFAKEHGRQVTITTYNSLLIQLRNGTLRPEDFELVILDECHRSMSHARKNAVRQFTNAIKLGFSATPRSDGDFLEREIHNMNIREAVESNLLSPFSAYIARTQVDLSNVTITQGGDYDEDELEKIINTEARNKSAVDLYQQMFAGQSAVAYCSGINHAETLAQKYRDQGISAEVISGRTRNKQEILDRYARGEIQVLCNADILIEGFDEPRANVCLNLRPTLSRIVAEQRAGRVLRLDENNPHKHAYVVDFIDQSDDPRHQPITFAQVAGAARMMPITSGGAQTEGSGNNHNDEPEEPEINIEGLVVITNAVEVMRIISNMEVEMSRPAPEGWVVVGHEKVENSLVALLNKGQRWINIRLLQVIEKLQKEQEEKGISPEDREEFFGEFLDKNNILRTFYSPVVLERLKNLSEQAGVAPEGWMVLGSADEENTLAGVLNKSKSWVGKRILQVIEKLQKEQEEKGIPPEEREEFSGEFLNQQGQLRTFYSQAILEELRRLSEQAGVAPEGWLLVGTISHENTLAGILQKSENWFKSHLSQVIEKLQKEQEEKGIPPEEREEFSGEFLNQQGQLRTFYSPAVLGQLKKLSEQAGVVPSGWIRIGSKNQKDTLAGILNKSETWIKIRLPKIIEILQKEQEEKGIPPEEREEFSGEFLDKQNDLKTFYSPVVLERLKNLSERVDAAPQGWITIGDKNYQNTLCSILNKSATWIKQRIPEIMETLQKKQEEKGIPPEEREEFSGEFLNQQGQTVMYYSPAILEKLRRLSEQVGAPQGWITIGDKTLTTTLKKSLVWIKPRIHKVIEILQKEQEEKGIPPEEREEFSGEFLDQRKVPRIFYSPQVIEALRKLAEKE